MFHSGDSKILMRYKNVHTSVADFTGGFITLVRHVSGRVEFLVDNLKGQKEWLPMSQAFKVSPALHRTMLDLYCERYQGCGGEKQQCKLILLDMMLHNHGRA